METKKSIASDLAKMGIPVVGGQIRKADIVKAPDPLSFAQAIVDEVFSETPRHIKTKGARHSWVQYKKDDLMSFNGGAAWDAAAGKVRGYKQWEAAQMDEDGDLGGEDFDLFCDQVQTHLEEIYDDFLDDAKRDWEEEIG